jgi:hypothetical protein
MKWDVGLSPKPPSAPSVGLKLKIKIATFVIMPLPVFRAIGFVT